MAGESLYLPSAVGDRASFDLIWGFSEGVKDGINQVWSGTDGTALKSNIPLLNVFDTLRVTSSATAQNVYTYAGSDYEQGLTNADQTPSYMNLIYEQTIPNTKAKRRFVRIDRMDWTDDNIGKYQTQFHALGTASVVAPYRFVVNTMRTGFPNGNTSLPQLVSGIDGVAFYGTHYSTPKDTTTTPQPNTFVEPGGLTRISFAKYWGVMVGWKGEDGQVAGSVPSVLCVGPQDLDTALSIAYLEKPAELAGGGNTYRGRVEVCFIPEWGETSPGANDGVWALIDARNSLERAWIFQEREPNKIHPLVTNPMDPRALEQDYLSWLLQGRWEVGMGHYRRILRVTRK